MGLLNDQQMPLGRLPVEVAEALFEGVPIWIEVLRKGKGPCGCSKEPRLGHAICSIKVVYKETRRRRKD
jgi:hypothetical protein